MKNNYSIKIAWNDSENSFVATVPEFPYLSAFGKTKLEAFKEAEILIADFLDILDQDGIKPPEPQKNIQEAYSGQVRLRMPKSLHKDLAVSAEREGVSLNAYMNIVLAKQTGAENLSVQLVEKINILINNQNQHFATLSRKINQHGKPFIPQGKMNPWQDVSGNTINLNQ